MARAFQHVSADIAKGWVLFDQFGTEPDCLSLAFAVERFFEIAIPEQGLVLDGGAVQTQLTLPDGKVDRWAHEQEIAGVAAIVRYCRDVDDHVVGQVRAVGCVAQAGLMPVEAV